MNFRTTYSDVIISNRALAKLPEMPISTMTFASLPARTCNMHYKPVVRQLLEAHDWGLAQKRETLAESATNPHPGYTYAYEEPNDLAFLVSVEYPVHTVGHHNNRVTQRFERVGGLICTNVPNAVAVYTSLDITEDQFTELFVEAAALHLAARIAVPVTKKQDLEDKLTRAANAYVNSAIANYRNQQGHTYGHEYSETDAVRQTGFVSAVGGSFGHAADHPSNSGR
jgi:hypothetical protein